ncbi:MAG: hypothetical protein ACK4NS_06585 [Saprospiraceae bacterium]
MKKRFTQEVNFSRYSAIEAIMRCFGCIFLFQTNAQALFFTINSRIIMNRTFATKGAKLFLVLAMLVGGLLLTSTRAEAQAPAGGLSIGSSSSQNWKTTQLALADLQQAIIDTRQNMQNMTQGSSNWNYAASKARFMRTVYDLLVIMDNVPAAFDEATASNSLGDTHVVHPINRTQVVNIYNETQALLTY